MEFFYVEAPTGKFCFQDVEFAPRTQNVLDRYSNKVDALNRFLENHPKLLQRKDPDPVKLAELAARRQAVTDEVVTALVLRGEDENGQPAKVTIANPTYLCIWDGRSPYVDTLLGTFPAAGIPWCGWPQTDVQPE